MGQILSNSEVEAILSGLDLTHPAAEPANPETSSPISAELPLYDFEHPEPLNRSQMDGLRLAAASTGQNLQSCLSRILRTQVQTAFLGVEQSTYHDYLATADTPCCLAVFESSSLDATWILEISRSLAFTLVDGMLGGLSSTTRSPVTLSRPFTDVESRIINKAVSAALPALAAGMSLPDSLQVSRLISDGNLLAEATSNEAVALVTFEVTCGTTKGLMQLCAPWRRVTSKNDRASVVSGNVRERMKLGANKLPVLAVACLTHLKLSAHDVANLAPGDVLLTDVSVGEEIRLEVDGQEMFRGSPGQKNDRKVILLSSPVARREREK